jgi:hypothetical protein
MIDAQAFPGPALWQGLMLLSMPIYIAILFGTIDSPHSKAYAVAATIGEVILGVGLFIWIAL